MSERMKNAMALADKCWSKAKQAEPRFVEGYLLVAEQLLLSKPVVNGDEFRKACELQGLRRPANLHPNVWVSGPNALARIGWTTKLGKTIPKEMHNHMNLVTQWHSNIYK